MENSFYSLKSKYNNTAQGLSVMFGQTKNCCNILNRYLLFFLLLTAVENAFSITYEPFDFDNSDFGPYWDSMDLALLHQLTLDDYREISQFIDMFNSAAVEGLRGSIPEEKINHLRKMVGCLERGLTLQYSLIEYRMEEEYWGYEFHDTYDYPEFWKNMFEEVSENALKIVDALIESQGHGKLEELDGYREELRSLTKKYGVNNHFFNQVFKKSMLVLLYNIYSEIPKNDTRHIKEKRERFFEKSRRYFSSDKYKTKLTELDKKENKAEEIIAKEIKILVDAYISNGYDKVQETSASEEGSDKVREKYDYKQKAREEIEKILRHHIYSETGFDANSDEAISIGIDASKIIDNLIRACQVELSVQEEYGSGIRDKSEKINSLVNNYISKIDEFQVDNTKKKIQELTYGLIKAGNKKNSYHKERKQEVARLLNSRSENGEFSIPADLHRIFDFVQAFIYYQTNKASDRYRGTKISYETNSETGERKAVKVSIDDETTFRVLNALLHRYVTMLKSRLVVHRVDLPQDIVSHAVNARKAGDAKEYLYFLTSASPMIHLREARILSHNIAPLRSSMLQEGDIVQSVFRNVGQHSLIEPTSRLNFISPVKKAKQIAESISQLQSMLDEKYPGHFRIAQSEKNMFEVSVQFVSPYGWWKHAYYDLTFSFDNVESDGANLVIKHGPQVAHRFGPDLCMLQNYKEVNTQNGLDSWWQDTCGGKVRYGSTNFSIAQQMLNVINMLIIDYDINEEGILCGLDLNNEVKLAEAVDRVVNEIANKNRMAEAKSDIALIVSRDKIKAELEGRLMNRDGDGTGPGFDYLALDNEKIVDEQFASDLAFFMPVNMQRESDVIEFDARAIKKLKDIATASHGSRMRYHRDVKPEVYVDNQLITDDQKLVEALNKLLKKRKVNDSKLAMLVNIKNYDANSYLNAIGLDRKNVMRQKIDRMRPYGVESELEEMKVNIHLFSSIGIAKENNMAKQYRLSVPPETQKMSERFRGKAQFGNNANAWIPAFSESMTDAQKELVIMAMHEFAQYFLGIGTTKINAVFEANNIATKGLLLEDDDSEAWSPSQGLIDFILQRAEMSAYITRTDKQLSEQLNGFFADLLNEKELTRDIIPDLGFYMNYVVPGLEVARNMDNGNKAAVVRRIILGYLRAIAARILARESNQKKSAIVDKLLKKPGNLSFNDVITSNKTGVMVAANNLVILDFLITRVLFGDEASAFRPVTEGELESLQASIKALQNLIHKTNGSLSFSEFVGFFLSAQRHGPDGFDFEDESMEQGFYESVLSEVSKRTKNRKLHKAIYNYLSDRSKLAAPRYESGLVRIFDRQENDRLVADYQSWQRIFHVNEKKTLEEMKYLAEQDVLKEPDEELFKDGGYLQTCIECGEDYATIAAVPRVHSHPEKVKPVCLNCRDYRKKYRKEADELMKRIKRTAPKKRSLVPYVNHYAPIPEEFRLVRIAGDGDCMFTAIASAYNHLGADWEYGSEQNQEQSQEHNQEQKRKKHEPLSQQDIRNEINLNLNRILGLVNDSVFRDAFRQELALLTGIDASMLDHVVSEGIIVQSAGTLSRTQTNANLFRQQMGESGLIPLLEASHSIPFGIHTDLQSDDIHFGLQQWVRLAPSLLAHLLRHGEHFFPYLDSGFVHELVSYLQSGDTEAAYAMVSQHLPQNASTYLIYYPELPEIGQLGHFDLAVRAENPLRSVEPMAAGNEQLSPEVAASSSIIAGAPMNESPNENQTIEPSNTRDNLFGFLALTITQLRQFGLQYPSQ